MWTYGTHIQSQDGAQVIFSGADALAVQAVNSPAITSDLLEQAKELASNDRLLVS